MARSTHDVRPIVAGIAVLVHDLARHLKAHGNVYRRVPMVDSRVVRLVLGRSGRGSDDFVPFDEVVRHYGDLAATDADAPRGPAPEDEALLRLLAEHAPRGGIGLDVGCGVGRSTFSLRAFLDEALGVDRSAARVRRARNLATTRADFFVPVVPSPTEAAGSPRRAAGKDERLDLERLVRDRVDFAVADAFALPLADGAIDVVVLRRGDGRGPWPDASAALAEARRVLAPGGLLALEAEAREGGDPFGALGSAGALATDAPWVLYRHGS